MDLNVAVVINKAQLPKFVHEKAHARSRRTDHFGQRFLTHFRDDWLRPTFLSASRVTPSSVPDKSDETPANVALEPATPAGYRNLEFQTDAWSEAYIRRIDDTIAALKTSGVPVFWVGLPPLPTTSTAAGPIRLVSSISIFGTVSSTRTAATLSLAPTFKVRPDDCAPATACTSPRPEPENLPTMSSAKCRVG